MPLKLLPFKDLIISEYQSGKGPEAIAKENGWYPQAITNLLKHFSLYVSPMPNQGNIRYFQKCDSHQKAYFLGFIAADGCIYNTENHNARGFAITIKETDIQILTKLREEIGCENKVSLIRGKCSYDKTKEKYHCRFQLYNKDLYLDLISYGLTIRKSTTMPNIILNIPKKYRKSFILGYFDGDGSVCPNLKRKQLMVSFRGTKDFLMGIATELNLSKSWLAKDKQKESHQLVFWRKSDLINFAKIYKKLDFFLARKYQRLADFLKIGKDETISPS